MRRRAALVVAILLAAGGAAAWAGDGPRLHHSSARGNAAEAGEQSAGRAPCDSGRRAVGGGVVTHGGWREAEVSETAPETQSRATAWFGVIDAETRLRARIFVICVGGESAARLGYDHLAQNIHPGRRGELIARCPGASSVIGGGVESNAGFAEAGVVASRPADGPDADHRKGDAWLGAIENRSDDRQRLEVLAICARGVLGDSLRYSKTRLNVDEGEHRAARVLCDGGDSVAAGGAVVNGRAHLSASAPIDADGDARHDDGWRAIADGEAGGGRVTAHAVCTP
jgi:hypothetical protein